MDKAERLLDLVALLLDAREPVSFGELRELFPEEYGGNRDSASRKLERDKAELQALGVPIEYVTAREDERDVGGYRINRAEYFLPDPRLAPEESAALYAAGAAALDAHDFPFAQDLEHALRKLTLAADAPPAAAAARRLLVVRPGAHSDKLRALADAVARRKRVHLVYEAPPSFDGKPGEKTERDVDPWGLAFRGGAWRLVGHCHLRQAERQFVVDRIAALTVNARLPASPDFDEPKDFDVGEAAGQKPWQWPHHPYQVVHISGPYLVLQRAFDASEGKVGVRFLDGLIPTVLQLGDKVVVEKPPAAREKVVSALRKLQRLLQQPVEPPPTQPQPPAPPTVASAAPPAERQDRLRRLLLIVPAARKKRGVTVRELAQQLGLSDDELREDIALLAVVGRPPFSPDDLIDISIDERDRITVALDQSFSRPPQLTALEALALAAAAEEVAPADPAVRTALAKLTARLPASARGLYAGLARRVASATPAPKAPASGALAQLRHAAEQRREVALDYDKDGSGEPAERIFRPLLVLDHGGRWYVVGHDVGRNAERTFRVDRVMAVRETGASFPDAGPIDAARFQREQLFFPSGRELPVTLRFSAAAAQWALQRYGAQARALADGRVDVTVESAGPSWAVSLALSLAGEAEIVAPEDARAALREVVDKSLGRYS